MYTSDYQREQSVGCVPVGPHKGFHEVSMSRSLVAGVTLNLVTPDRTIVNLDTPPPEIAGK